MASPKPKEDDLEIPAFLDRRKQEPKPDSKVATADASSPWSHLAPKSQAGTSWQRIRRAHIHNSLR